MKTIPPMEVELDGLFKRLHLANARRVWRDLITRAEQEQWTYHQLLTVLVAEEIAQRQQTRLARLSRRAGFPRPGHPTPHSSGGQNFRNSRARFSGTHKRHLRYRV